MSSTIRSLNHRDRAGSAIGLRRARRRRPFLERLEDRQLLAGIVNGDFSISDPADPNYGWVTRGDAAIANGQGTLAEGTTIQAGFSQTFTIPQGATSLRFVIVGASLITNGTGNPPDAFEAALLDAQTQEPLVGPPTGLGNTDSFLNIQETGEVFYAPGVSVPGAGASGSIATLSYPELVTVDVSQVAGDTDATLFFDLIGILPASSSVRITNVAVVSGAAVPIVSFVLDPSTDSGDVGDGVTNFNPVNFLGTTDPNQTVSLDLDGDGFDDGTTVADSNGHFEFTAVPLSDGINTVRVEATNAQGSTIDSQTITVDTQVPTGTLVDPIPDSTTSTDLGYVDVQWTDDGTSGIDPATFGTDDVTITGVTVDQVQDLGNNLRRYRYDLDGDTLDPGTVSVVLVAGQVADHADNVNAPATQSFVFQLAPVADAQAITVAQDTPKAVVLTGTDFNTPPLPLTFTVTTGPLHGALSGTAPNLTYTPAVGYIGSDSFQFTASNGLFSSDAATVSITVIGKPIANAQSVTTVLDTAASITLTGLDPNTPTLPLTYTITTSPLHGTLSGTAPDLTFTPTAGYFGPDSFQFRVNNGTLDSELATVAITVIGRPAADSQSVTVAQDTASSITLTGVDPNAPPLALSYVVTVGPAQGTLSGDAPNLVYTPNAGYFGSDAFQFTVSNGSLSSAPSAVSLNVVGRPTANGQTVTVVQDRAGAITLSGSDPNSPALPLTYVVTVNPEHGTLSGVAPQLTYTPAAGYSGPDSLQFKVNNGTLDSSVATVAITVTASTTGQLPVANDDAYSTGQNKTLSVGAPGVLGNDLSTTVAPTAVLVTGPANGTLTFETDGSFTYQPSSNFTGADTFTYRAIAGSASGNVATVRLTVTPAAKPVLPNTPRFDFLRRRRNLNPARFDFYHPELGALLGMELGGSTSTAVKIISKNGRLNVSAARIRYQRNPVGYVARHPILGALFRLESLGHELGQSLGQSAGMTPRR